MTIFYKITVWVLRYKAVVLILFSIIIQSKIVLPMESTWIALLRPYLVIIL